MRLYFDECCSRRLPRELKALYPELEAGHVLDNYDRGTAESDWLKPLQEDRALIVISNDRGRNPKKEKLYAVCAALGITHVVLTPTLINAGYEAHKAALIAVWGQLLKLHQLPPGSRVRLGIDDDPKGTGQIYALRIGAKPLSSFLPS